MIKLKPSRAKVICFKCGHINGYKSAICVCCEDLMGEIEPGIDCAEYKFATPNSFGNGDVFCAKKVEGSTGIGYYCELFEPVVEMEDIPAIAGGEE